MSEAFRKTGVKDQTDYHHLDVLSIAWNKLFDKIGVLGLSKIAKHLNLPEEPLPHRAINGAKLALEVYKKLH